jgi:hypothetical protein
LPGERQGERQRTGKEKGEGKREKGKETEEGGRREGAGGREEEGMTYQKEGRKVQWREQGVHSSPSPSGALKIVGEAFPFDRESAYVLTQDNHNSVNGIREYARAKGAVSNYVTFNDDLTIDEDVLDIVLLKRMVDGGGGWKEGRREGGVEGENERTRERERGEGWRDGAKGNFFRPMV